MKKFTVVLLIAVLALTSVFADLDVKVAGSLTAEYAYDFDEKTFGYTTPNADVDVKFDFGATDASVAGEGLRAELATKFYWVQPDNYEYIENYSVIKLSEDAKMGYFMYYISAFNIKNADIWTLNLLKAKAVGNYAVSPIDFAKYTSKYESRAIHYYKLTKTAAYSDTFSFSTSKGVTFSWNGFTFAAAANGTIADDKVKDIYAGVETPNFNLGSGLTLQGAGAFNYTGDKANLKYNTKTEVDEAYYDSWEVAGSLKFGYASDAMTIALATDQALTFGKNPNKTPKTGSKVYYDVDASLVAKFAPATVSAYFGKNVAAVNTEGVSPVVINSFKNLLSGKVEFDLACFHAPIKATITGLNLLNGAKILSTDFQFTFAEKYVVKAYANDLLTSYKYYTENVTTDDQIKYYKDNGAGQQLGLSTVLPFGPVETTAEVYTRLNGGVFNAKDYKTVGFAVGAEYTNAYFVADASVSAEFVAGQKASENGLLMVSAAVESDNVIQNAVVGVCYDSVNLLDNTYTKFNGSTKDHGIGAASAYVTVSF